MYVVRYDSIIRVGRTLLSIVGPFATIAEACQWRDAFAKECVVPPPSSSIDMIVPPDSILIQE